MSCQIVIRNKQRKVFIVAFWFVNYGQKYVVKIVCIKEKTNILCRNSRHNQKKYELSQQKST